MRAFTRPKLLAWAGFSLALGITIIAVALYGGGPRARVARLAPAIDVLGKPLGTFDAGALYDFRLSLTICPID